MPLGVVAHAPNGRFDIDALIRRARAWNGLVGLDLAKDASAEKPFDWDEGAWSWPHGHSRGEGARHVVVVDYGVKRNILRSLVSIGARVSVAQADASAEEILAQGPDGIVLSNGPGDPAATALYAAPVIRKLVESGVPVFGICLGHHYSWRWPWARGPKRWTRAPMGEPPGAGPRHRPGGNRLP